MSMDVRKVKLDFNKVFQDEIPSVQGDTGRSIEFQIMDGSVAKDITGETIKIFGLKPDGFRVFNNATITDATNGKCIVDLTQQMLAIAGTVQCTLVRYKNNQRLSSKKFNIIVDETVADDIEIESSSEYLALIDALNVTSENLNTSVNTVINQMITEGKLANMTIGNNSITTNKYKDNSITLDKISFARPSKNLFNKNTAIANTVLLGATTGATQTMSGNTCSDYIEVKSSTNYRANNVGNYAFYNADKTYISGANSYNSVMASPSNARYLRMSFNSTKVDINDVQIEEGNASTDYEEYKVVLDPKHIKLTDSYIDEIYKGYNVDGKSIVECKNLYNKNDANNKDNYLVDSRYGTLTANTSHSASDYIKVEPNTTYVINVGANIAFYDSSRSYVGRAYDSDHSSNVTVPAGTPFTTTGDTAYIRFSIKQYTMYKDTCQLEKGNYITDYIEYGVYKINNDLLSRDDAVKKGEGLKLVTYGDSITAQNKWQGHVKSALGFNTIVNLGIGGTHVGSGYADAFCDPTRITTIPTDADVITIMGGTNDCGSASAAGRAIGDMSYPFDTTTFKGGLASTITQIQERCPNAIIIVMSPVGGRGEEAGVNMTDVVYNQKGLTTEDYAIACQQVAHSLSIPFIDVFGESGINQFNRATYIADTVHPNDAGGEKMARVIINGMNRIL